MVNKKLSPSPIVESGQSQAETGRVPILLRPALPFKDFLKVICTGRSKAYELMKTDPDFPKGIPLYDGDRSPKFYWTHEAMAWLEARSNKFRNQSKDN